MCVLVEHVDLRRRAMSVDAQQPTHDDLRELGEALAKHIRHEERVLFPLIEATVPEPELAALGQAIADAEDRR